MIPLMLVLGRSKAGFKWEAREFKTIHLLSMMTLNYLGNRMNNVTILHRQHTHLETDTTGIWDKGVW